MKRRRIQIIAVIGSGQCDSATTRLAEEVGLLLAERGAILICGGLGGVMEGACRGAKKVGGLTVGLLPGSLAAAANQWVDVPIATGLGEARNAIVTRAASAVIAIGGEYGTLSEMALALKMGTPVIGLKSWNLRRGKWRLPIRHAKTAAEAVRLAFQAAGV